MAPGKRTLTQDIASAAGEASTPAHGPSTERLEVRPKMGRFKPTEIGRSRHDDVTLTNVSHEPVDFFDFLETVLVASDGIERPAGDFAVVGGETTAEPLQPGASTRATVEFKPRATDARDLARGRHTLRKTRFLVLDADGAGAGAIELEGRARAPSDDTIDDGEVADVTSTVRQRGQRLPPPQTYDEMRTHLMAAADLMDTSERDAALELVVEVRDRMYERLRYDQVWQAFRAYGMGTQSATMMVAHARDEVNGAAVRLAGGLTVDLDRVLISFQVAKEPIQLVLGEVDHAPTIAAMHDASPAVLAGRGAAALGDTAVQTLTDAAFSAGFGVGVLEGAVGAIHDLATGATAVLELAFDIAKAMVTSGLIGVAMHAAEEMSELFDTVPAALKEMGIAFEQGWNASGSYARGNFRGEVIGYVATQIAIVILSGGAAAEGVAFASLSRWGKVAAIIQKLDAAGDVTAWATKLGSRVRVPAALEKKWRRTDVPGSGPRSRDDASRRTDPRGDRIEEPAAVSGAAQSPRLTWMKNPDGAIRTVDEAVEIARKHGVEIPDDILLRKVKGKALPKNTAAEYFSRRMDDPNKGISWEEFYDEDLDQILVRVDDAVFESDEAIVAIMAHEMHELNNLRRLFEENGGSMRAAQLRRLIHPGIKGNLHDQAWDVADRAVLEMRRAKENAP